MGDCLSPAKRSISIMSVVGIFIYIPSTLPDRRKANPVFMNSPFKAHISSIVSIALQKCSPIFVTTGKLFSIRNNFLIDIFTRKKIYLLSLRCLLLNSGTLFYIACIQLLANTFIFNNSQTHCVTVSALASFSCSNFILK